MDDPNIIAPYRDSQTEGGKITYRSHFSVFVSQLNVNKTSLGFRWSQGGLRNLRSFGVPDAPYSDLPIFVLTNAETRSYFTSRLAEAGGIPSSMMLQNAQMCVRGTISGAMLYYYASPNYKFVNIYKEDSFDWTNPLDTLNVSVGQLGETITDYEEEGVEYESETDGLNNDCQNVIITAADTRKQSVPFIISTRPGDRCDFPFSVFSPNPGGVLDAGTIMATKIVDEEGELYLPGYMICGDVEMAGRPMSSSTPENRPNILQMVFPFANRIFDASSEIGTSLIIPITGNMRSWHKAGETAGNYLTYKQWVFQEHFPRNSANLNDIWERQVLHGNRDLTTPEYDWRVEAMAHAEAFSVLLP